MIEWYTNFRKKLQPPDTEFLGWSCRPFDHRMFLYCMADPNLLSMLLSTLTWNTTGVWPKITAFARFCIILNRGIPWYTSIPSSKPLLEMVYGTGSESGSQTYRSGGSITDLSRAALQVLKINWACSLISLCFRLWHQHDTSVPSVPCDATFCGDAGCSDVLARIVYLDMHAWRLTNVPQLQPPMPSGLSCRVRPVFQQIQDLMLRTFQDLMWFSMDPVAPS